MAFPYEKDDPVVSDILHNLDVYSKIDVGDRVNTCYDKVSLCKPTWSNWAWRQVYEDRRSNVQKMKRDVDTAFTIIDRNQNSQLLTITENSIYVYHFSDDEYSLQNRYISEIHKIVSALSAVLQGFTNLKDTYITDTELVIQIDEIINLITEKVSDYNAYIKKYFPI